VKHVSEVNDDLPIYIRAAVVS